MAGDRAAFSTPLSLGACRGVHSPCLSSCQRGGSGAAPTMCAKKPRGLLGKLRDAILRPIVSVPGSQNTGELLDCVFCKASGYQPCSGCSGSGKDALGRCLMCDGKGKLMCDVCSGVGIVDRIRRGGTDDKNEYVVKARRPSQKQNK